MNKPYLTIYGAPGCSRCQVLVQRCQRKGVPYRYVDVTKDAKAAAHLKALGYTEAPVGECGDDHWAGVRLDKVDALARTQLAKAS